MGGAPAPAASVPDLTPSLLLLCSRWGEHLHLLLLHATGVEVSQPAVDEELLAVKSLAQFTGGWLAEPYNPKPHNPKP